MPKKTRREQSYGSYVFRRKRKGKTEIFARVGYYDQNGQWKYKYEKADSEEDATAKAEILIKTYKRRGTAFIDGSNMTFEQFADWYKENYVIEPNYEQGQQVAGLRTYRNVKSQIERLKIEFGKKKISRIDADLLHRFKNKRKNIDLVKTATVNRDLELLRAMFNKAVKQGWLEESPFQRAENLIRKSLEARRRVTTSLDEERLVLKFARQSKNKHLYPLVLALRDTGARPSELFPYAAYGADLEELPKQIKSWLETEVKSDGQIFLPLCWFQLFKVEFKVVPLISLKSRQIEYRFATMTTRLREALLDLWETTDKNIVKLVFPFKSIKKEWQRVREDTALYTVFSRIVGGIDPDEKKTLMDKAFGEKSAPLLEFLQSNNPDISELIAKAREINADLLTDDVDLKYLRIRDWRRIYATNAPVAGVAENMAQRMLGHKLLQTTYHYSEADLENVIRASRTLDEFNNQPHDLSDKTTWFS